MTVVPELVGGKLVVPGQDRPLDMSPGEVLIGMAMQELLAEVVRIRQAVVALISDPGNPYSAAEAAKTALGE